MLWTILIACALFISILESTIFSQIGFLGIRPNFFLIFAVLSALNLDPPEASISACIMGLCKDVLSEEPLGLNASFFTGIAIIIGVWRHKIYANSISAQLLVVLIASIVYRGGSALVVWLSYGNLAALPTLLNIFVGSTYTAVLAAGPYFLFKTFRPVRLRQDIP
ncbi:MAG TPA: rod shape-determining protein MreD [Candidatus Avalokitesvara rifleensis]|uniref:rod shape-determining protein MreD n=1 Tax=Candidatus Avalokitesvara rifleensis TaxID=3367620 RepID=UPI0027138542|nr:rod shape-determining protein MreD [Candidatus Brocadiales bacterium]